MEDTELVITLEDLCTCGYLTPRQSKIKDETDYNDVTETMKSYVRQFNLLNNEDDKKEFIYNKKKFFRDKFNFSCNDKNITYEQHIINNLFLEDYEPKIRIIYLPDYSRYIKLMKLYPKYIGTCCN